MAIEPKQITVTTRLFLEAWLVIYIIVIIVIVAIRNTSIIAPTHTRIFGAKVIISLYCSFYV